MKLSTERFLVLKFNGTSFDVAINKNHVEIGDSDIENNFIVIPIKNDFVIIWNGMFHRLPGFKKDGSFEKDKYFIIPNEKLWFASIKGPYKTVQTNYREHEKIDSILKDNGYNFSLWLFIKEIIEDCDKNDLWNKSPNL